MATIWIGGSSGLARTYVGVYGHNGLILAGVEAKPPSWASNAIWCTFDLTDPESIHRQLFLPLKTRGQVLETLILGVRAPLLIGDGNHEALLQGMSVLLEVAAQAGIRSVIHISSVAAADHLRAQVLVDEETPLPPLDEYQGSYDIFKRKSEEIVSTICKARKIPHVHLRISAIFSDTPHCIQCNALELQARIGAYLPTRIDCNSSRNVAIAVNLLQKCILKQDVSQEDTCPQHYVYYYTRPTMYPVAYGEYLKAYRHAHDIQFTIWLPYSVVAMLVSVVHWVVWKSWLRHFPTAVSIDYLLQVSAREHTFDNSRFRRDFPEITKQEESIVECFARRRLLLQSCDGKPRGFPTALVSAP